MTNAFKISSDYFVWTSNTGICEVTDLPYRIAVDRPIYVESSKTGKVIEFEPVGEMVNVRGVDVEIEGWCYTSVCGNFNIKIVND